MGKHYETKEGQKEKQKARKKVKNKKKKHLGRKILLLLFLIVIIVAIIFAKKVNDLEGNWLAVLLGHNKTTIENLEELQVLILGESTGMSDTIIVAKYNPRTQEAALLSIPRDTFTGSKRSSANSSHKINSLYASGEKPEKTLEAVNKITGLNIEKYIIVDTKALRELVNIIGGVEFDVPINMKYDDYSQDLHINLKKGYQKLTGEQAEQVARFRHNNNGSTYSCEYGTEDYGRMKTQRNLVIAIAKQTIKAKNITEIGKIIDTMKNNVETNINFAEIKDYIPYAVEIDLDSIQTEQLPGESDRGNGIWFFFYDEDETEEIVDRLFKGIEPEQASEEIDNNI